MLVDIPFLIRSVENAKKLKEVFKEIRVYLYYHDLGNDLPFSPL